MHTVCMHTHIHANAACIYTAYTQYCENTMHYAYTRKPTLCFHPVFTHLYVCTYKHMRLPVRHVLTLTRCLCVTGGTLQLAQRKLYPKLLTQRGLWAQTTKAEVGCRGQLAQSAPIFSTVLGVLCHCTATVAVALSVVAGVTAILIIGVVKVLVVLVVIAMAMVM